MPIFRVPIPGGGEYWVDAGDEEAARQNVYGGGGGGSQAEAPRPAGGGGGGGNGDGGGGGTGSLEAPQPAVYSPPALPNLSDGQTFGQQSLETQAAFTAIYGAQDAATRWLEEHRRDTAPAPVAAPSGGVRYAPPSPQQAPVPLPPSLFQLRTDPYGGTRGTAGERANTPEAQAQRAQAVGTQAGTEGVVVTGPNGETQVVSMTPAQRAEFLTMRQREAEEARKAREFAQGIEQGKLDLERVRAEGQQAYQQALLQFNDRQLAQQAADMAQRAEIERQRTELDRQRLSLEQQRLTQLQGQQAATLSLEQEKLRLARRSLGSQRRSQRVRYV